MKNLKKSIALLLCLVVAVGLLPLSAMAADSFDLAWPCSNAWSVTCMYYYKTGDKHSTRYGYQYAMDIAGDGDILAAESGTVVTSDYQSGGFGNYIVIQHSNGYFSLYGHLASRSVSVGKSVSKGQKIGVMGTTGNSSGVHLHFEYSGADPWKTFFKSKYYSNMYYEQNVRSNNDNYNSDKTIVNFIDNYCIKKGDFYYYNGGYSQTNPSDMTTGTDGIELIKRFEGCRLTAYRNFGETYYTIGYGHYGSDVYDGMTITQAQAEKFLTQDIVRFEGYVNSFLNSYGITITQNQFDALVSFTYNLGNVWVSEPTFQLKTILINGTDNYSDSQITTAFTNWCHANGEVVQGLLNRRNAEAQLFLTGRSGSAPSSQSRFPTPLKAYTISTGKTEVYYSINGSAKYNKIYVGDECTITNIYDDSGWCYVVFPLDAGGTDEGFVRTSVFFDPSCSISTVTLTSRATTYARSDLSSEIGYADAGDTVYIVGTTSSSTQILYPLIAGGYKCGWVSNNTIPSQFSGDHRFPKPIEDTYTKGTGKTIVYSSINGSAKYNKIYDTDPCTITNFYDNGWCYVVFPLDEGGTDEGYVPTSVFFDPSSSLSTITLNSRITTYARSNLSQSVGYADAGDTVYIVSSDSSVTQIIYPLWNGNYKGGWVQTSEILPNHYLDLNGIIDGAFSGSINGAGTADIYINGQCVANDVSDYYTAWPLGTNYEIKDIKALSGYVYGGTSLGALSGTIGYSDVEIQLVYNDECGTKCNVGDDFYAVLLNTAYWKPVVHNPNTNNVELDKEIGCAKELWRFIRYSDNSYKIQSLYNGKCLEVADASSASGANVRVSDDIGSNAQRWFIYDTGTGGYTLKPKCSKCVLDLTDNSSEDGTNIETYTFNGSGAQIFSIYKGSESHMKAPTLNVNGGDTESGTTFTWNNVPGEVDYKLEIYSQTSTVSENLIKTCYYDEKTTSTIICLPSGFYEAKICARNWFNGFDSDVIGFSVKTATTPVTSVTLNKTSLSLNKGDTATLTATVAPDDATDKTVAWSTSDVNVATVADGVVTAVGSGTAVITAQAGDCTAECVVNVKTPLKITKQPESVTVPSGQVAYVTVEAQGDGLKYQWYIKNVGQSVFSKSSVTTNTYSVKMSASNNGRKIYCVITDKYGDKVSSNIATLSITSAPVITKQPQSVTVPSGQTASVTVEAQGEGLTYQWFIKNVGQPGFNKSSVTASTYTVKMSATSNGRQVYCVVTDKYGKSETSNTATLSMSADLAITKHPQSVTVPSGQTATVTVKADGEGLKYQWFVKNVGQSVFGKSSITTNTYTVKMSAASNGRQVYCVVTDKYGKSETSNTATLSMSTGLAITKHPQSVTVPSGQTATVTVKADGEGLKYQWFVKNVGQSVFGKSSVTTNTYTVKMSATSNGRQVYCVVTDKYGKSETSNTATLSMSAELKITKQPTDVTAAPGATATVTVTAQGDGLTYQWYVKNVGQSVFGKSSVTSNTYSVKMSASNDGRQLYCVVKDQYGNSIKSNVVTLHIG